MNRGRLTIRARITGGSLLIALLVSAVAGIVIYSQVQRIVHDGTVRVLESVQGPYATAITTGDTEEWDQPGPGQYVAVIDPTGAVPVDTLPDTLGPPDELASTGEGEVTVNGLVVLTAQIDGAGGTWQVVTASMADDQVLNAVAVLLITSIAVINLAFGAASWFIGSAALSPVTRLRRSAAELVTATGDELLPVGVAKDEIADLARTLNELIAGLRASADRERRIVSDASHELRTPLAILQTRLELAQAQASTLDELRSDVAAAQETVARMSALANSLLELSRIDAQAEPGSATVRALADELADAVDRGRQRVSSHDILIDYVDGTASGAATVAVGDADFGRVCDNLISNCVNAIGASGAVRLELTETAGALRLSVSDDGGGMSPHFVAHAFDRFSRESDARTTRGAGLGLSIVSGIATTSGGRVELHNAPGVGVRVDVVFPLVAVLPPVTGDRATSG